MAILHRKIDIKAAMTLWKSALSSRWQGPPVWLHGDVSSGNLLVKEGKLCAVIDFGNSSVGDPACDLTIAWTLLSGEARDAFRAAVNLDNETWGRARGWALWKALITLRDCVPRNLSETNKAQHIVNEVVGDHHRGA